MSGRAPGKDTAPPGSAENPIRVPVDDFVQRAIESTRPNPPVAGCVTGVENGCLSYRCGSDCTNEHDRMHPCPACIRGGAA